MIPKVEKNEENNSMHKLDIAKTDEYHIRFITTTHVAATIAP